MTVIEALKKTTESIRDWINSKITQDLYNTKSDSVPSVNAVKDYVNQEIIS